MSERSEDIIQLDPENPEGMGSFETEIETFGDPEQGVATMEEVWPNDYEVTMILSSPFVEDMSVTLSYTDGQCTGVHFGDETISPGFLRLVNNSVGQASGLAFRQVSMSKSHGAPYNMPMQASFHPEQRGLVDLANVTALRGPAGIF